MGTDPRTGCALLRPWPQRRAPTQGPDARCLRAAAGSCVAMGTDPRTGRARCLGATAPASARLQRTGADPRTGSPPTDGVSSASHFLWL
jgi:hypothetical protein